MERAQAEAIRTLYSQSAPVLIANVVNATIVTVGLWHRPQRSWVVAWLTIVGFVSLVRFALTRRYMGLGPQLAQTAVWGRRFVLGSAVSGTLWGVAALAFFDPAFVSAEVLLTFAIGGMSAAAAGTLACHLPAFAAFVTPALALFGVRLLLFGETAFTLTAAFVVVFAVGLSVVARNNHRALIEAFRLRFENHELVESLTDARRSLEEANRTLEARVAERSAALEVQSEALRDARRLESLGLLAGGVAHDFNNLLTVMSLNVNLLRQAGRLPPDAVSSVEEIGGSVGRAAELVRQLLAIGRKQVLAPQTFDLNCAVTEIEKLLRRLIGEHIGVALNLHAAPVWVTADLRQIEQVIINLVVNARDAMPSGGQLTIETGLPGGEFGVLTVADSGVGIDAETQARIFDPFFTTKKRGEGTGLGLATVHGIVKQSGGHVTVESRPHEGSVFRVCLPLAPRPPARPQVPEPAPTAMAALHGATVLIAEDDPMVQSVLVRFLTRSGWRVVAVDDGEKALAWAHAHEGPIDVLVTDVIMPHLGGPALVRALAESRPELRVLFISGHSAEEALPPPQPDQGLDYLQKPFTTAELDRALKRLLESPGQAAGLWAATPRRSDGPGAEMTGSGR